MASGSIPNSEWYQSGDKITNSNYVLLPCYANSATELYGYYFTQKKIRSDLNISNTLNLAWARGLGGSLSNVSLAGVSRQTENCLLITINVSGAQQYNLYAAAFNGTITFS